MNLVALAIFKYEDFFVPDLRATLNEWGVETGIGGLEWLLPVGMSFYIVAVISYLVDVYRGQVAGQPRSGGLRAVHGVFPQAAVRAD